MAVYTVTSVKSYVGTAAEMGALSTTGISVGSRFFQSDTGLWYVFGGTTWVKEIIPAA
jgi:hypothetical protein